MTDRADWAETVQKLRFGAQALRRQAEELRAAERDAPRRRFLRRSPELSEADVKEQVANEMEDAADRLEGTFPAHALGSPT